MKGYLFPLSCKRPCACSTPCVFNPMCVCMGIWNCIYSLSRAHSHVCVQPHVCLCVRVKMHPFLLFCSRSCACSDSDRFPCSSPWLSLSQLTSCIAPTYSLRLRCSDNCMQAGPVFPHLPSQQLSLFWINKYWESPSEFYYRILEHNKNSDGKKNNFPWEGGSRVGGTYEHLWLIHVVIWQRLTQHCKVIIL